MATPYNQDELKLLHAGLADTPEAAESLREYVKGRGKDLYDFLEEFIAKEKIPRRGSESGGIILAGWSFGTVFITSLLANAPTFPKGTVDVAAHMRCVLNYGMRLSFASTCIADPRI